MRFPRHRRAFTLVETLMALSLAAMLASGAAMLTLQVARHWSERETEPLFRRHVEGLSGFLEARLAQTRSDTLAVRAGLFSAPPGAKPGTPPAPRLLLRDIGTALPCPGEINPAGEGWLVHDPDRGLLLLWRTYRQRRDDDRALNVTLLSPWVTSLELLEYDGDRDDWHLHDPASPDLGRPLRKRLRLALKRFGSTAEIQLPLDPAPADAPEY